MNVRGLIVATVAASLATVAAGSCKKMGGDDKANSGATGATTAPTAASTTGPIIVGHFASMTGAQATFGTSTDNGIRLALEERNAAGGIKGRKIEVHTLDTASKTQEAGTVVTRLITNDHVVALLGEVASSASLAGAPVAQKYGVPMITPSSTNARVTQIGDMIFRVCFLDDFQGYVGAKFAHDDLKLSKVAILYDQGQAYSKGLAEEFKHSFEAMGGTIATEQAYTDGDADVSAQLQTIKGTGAELIYMPGYYTEAGNITRQARKLGITAPFLGGDGWDSAKLTEIGGDAIEGSYYSNHYSHQEQRPEVQDFVKKYQAKFGAVPDGLAALGYDAARVLFDAMDRAPSLGGKDLAAAIAATKDFPGVTGKITIDKDRNAVKQAVILQIKGGQSVFVTSIAPLGTEPAKAPPASAAAPALPAATDTTVAPNPAAPAPTKKGAPMPAKNARGGGANMLGNPDDGGGAQ